MRAITLGRKPLVSTVVQNVTEHGCGAFNVGATRVGSDNGRWPSNLVLAHHPGCKQGGTTMVPGYTINRWSDGAKPFGGGAGHEYESEKKPDEHVTVWDCARGCGTETFKVQGRSSGHYIKGSRKVGAKHGPASIPIDGVLSRSYADAGEATRYFKQIQETSTGELPQELIDYLEKMITPPDGEVLIVPDVSAVNWAEYEDAQLHGVVVIGTKADEFSGSDTLDQIWRVLRPGAHVAMIAPDEQQTGHTNTCALEDRGFEIRDSILLVQEPGRIHYVAKASTRERNAGIAPIKKEVQIDWCYPREDTDLDDLADALAEILDSEILEALADEGVAKAEIPKEFRDRFDTVKLNKIITVQNDHPTLKPKALMERLMADVPEGATVLDPFMGCYDDQTEVLTRTGWKPFSAVGFGDWFLTRCGSGKIEYQLPTDLHRYAYCGEMVRVKSRSTDLLVTPNHNMWGLTHADFNAGREPRMVRADALDRSVYRIPSGGQYKPEHDLFDRATMYLLGLYVSEGYLDSDRRYPNVIVTQNQGENWDQIMEWLAPFDPTTKGERRISIRVPWSLYGLIYQHCGESKYNKFLSATVLSNKHLDALFDAMVLGDGHVHKKHEQVQYWTVSPRLAGGFQELCVKLGFGSTLRVLDPKDSVMSDGRRVRGTTECFNICVTRSAHRKVLPDKHLTTELYDGEVFCVTVPNHTLYVRRNGRTTWCGNSGTTGLACIATNHSFMGIDLDEHHVKIASARAHYWESCERRPWSAEIDADVEPEEQPDPFAGMFEG